MDKFAAMLCSWRKQQLGLIIDSRKMIVTLPPEKLTRMTETLSKTWHTSRKSFTLLEGVTLLGHLEHACTVCPWGRYLYCAIRSAVNHCIRTGMKDISKLSHISKMTSAIRDAKTDDEKILFDNFVQKKVCKSLYSSKKPCFITKELRAELDYMLHIVSRPSTYRWEAPTLFPVKLTTTVGVMPLYMLLGGFPLT